MFPRTRTLLLCVAALLIVSCGYSDNDVERYVDGVMKHIRGEATSFDVQLAESEDLWRRRDALQGEYRISRWDWTFGTFEVNLEFANGDFLYMDFTKAGSEISVSNSKYTAGAPFN